MNDLSIEHLTAAASAKALHIGGTLLVALGIFLVAIVAGRLIALLLRRAAAKTPRAEPVLIILARAATVAALIVGSLSALQNLGVDVSAFVASLGLVGLTLGFALRDIVTSFVSGLLILAYKPFRPGDTIICQGVTGRVTAIDLRYTTLHEGERCHLVPNSTILTNPVTVLSASVPAATEDQP